MLSNVSRFSMSTVHTLNVISAYTVLHPLLQDMLVMIPYNYTE